MQICYCIILVLLCLTNAILIEGETRTVFEHTKATFGPDYGDTGTIPLLVVQSIEIRGNLVVVDPFNACQPIAFNITGKIGIAIRDQSITNCSFVDKVLHVGIERGILTDRSSKLEALVPSL